MNRLVNMMNEVKKLKNGRGVQQLIDDASKILGNPIAMFNTEYKLLAYSDSVNDDPIWNELITKGTFSKKTQELFETEGFIEEVANCSKVALLKTEKLKYERLSGKVFNKNNTYVANLVMVACNKPFAENDQVVFEAVCKLITREISTSEAYQEYEQNHQETIINNLIAGNFNKKLDIAQVGILYDSLASGIYLVVVDISQSQIKNGDKAYFRDLLKKANPKFKYAIYGDYIIIIVSTDNEEININKELKDLISIFEQNNLYAGISSRFENLFELQKHYNEALSAVAYVLECKSAQYIFPYNNKSLDKLKKINALENGKGIEYFLNVGAEILGNPLLFHDMEPNLLGCTENVEILDPIWQELITYGTGSAETVELFKTEGWVDIMDKTKGGALLVSDKCKYDRISWRIYNSDNIRFGCTSIVNTNKPFSEDELVLFGVFSQKFSKEVKKIEYYNKIGQTYSGTVINRLLSGKIDDYTFYSEDVGNLYDDLMDNIYLVVIDANKSSSESNNLKFFRDTFNRLKTINRFAIYENYIIIIISTNNPSLKEDKAFKEISKAFEQRNIHAGMSNCFDNIYDLPKHYKKAVNALNKGIKYQKPSSNNQVFMCEAVE